MGSPHNGVHHGRTKDPFSRHLSNPGCSPRKIDAWRVSKLSSGKTRSCGGCFIRGTLDDSATSPWNIYEKNRGSSFRQKGIIESSTEVENTTQIWKHQATNVNINLIADINKDDTNKSGDFPLTGPRLWGHLATPSKNGQSSISAQIKDQLINICWFLYFTIKHQENWSTRILIQC